MKIIFFDGVCNLCNHSVQFILKRDKRGLFSYSSLQSPFGQNFLQSRKLESNHFNTFILYEENYAYYTKSTAALLVLKELGIGWKVFSYLGFIIPAFIRDFVYTFIADNRYKWFGKRESCLLPEKKWKEKFID